MCQALLYMSTLFRMRLRVEGIPYERSLNNGQTNTPGGEMSFFKDLWQHCLHSEVCFKNSSPTISSHLGTSFPSTLWCAPLRSSDGWRGNHSPYRICGPIGCGVCNFLLKTWGVLLLSACWVFLAFIWKASISLFIDRLGCVWCVCVGVYISRCAHVLLLLLKRKPSHPTTHLTSSHASSVLAIHQ